MSTDVSAIRLLGAAFLIVFFASMISELLLKSAVGSSGSPSDVLVSVSENLTLIRISNLVALVNSLAKALLGCLLYIVFNDQHKVIALVALGWYLAEAIALAVSKIGAYALIPLSQEFVEAGTPESSFFQTLGDFLYSGVHRRGYDIHLLFFCFGAMLWYYLLHESRSIPPALSVWGLAAVFLLTIPVLWALYDRESTPALVMALGLPYAPYELFLGVWLVVKGFN